MSTLLAEDYFDDVLGNDVDDEDTEGRPMDSRTPLDRTIDRIGMGTRGLKNAPPFVPQG